MGDAEAEGGGRGAAGDLGVAVAAQVRVVDACGDDLLAGDGEAGAHVGEVVPAAFEQGGAQVLPGQGGAVDALLRLLVR